MRFLLFCFILPLFTFAQNIQYTKKNFDFTNQNMPVVAGLFNDTLHILQRNDKGRFDIYLYDRNMALINKRSLDSNSQPGNFNIQVIAYKKFYYVLLRGRGRERLRILQVNASGGSEDQTGKLKVQLHGIFPQYSAVTKFQMVQNLLMISATYYDSLEQQAYLSVFHFDSLLQKKDQHSLSFAYNPEENIINAIQFADTSTAYIIKSFRYLTSRFGQVEIFMFDFNTDKAIKRTIRSTENIFFSPVLDYDITDSSLLFFSSASQLSSGKASLKSSRYYCIRMNKELKEISPSRFMDTKQGEFEKNIFFIDKIHSISLNNIWVSSRQPNYYEMGGLGAIMPGRSYVRNYYPRPEPGYKRTDANMKIIWSDPVAGKKIDTLFKFKKGRFKVSYLNSFIWNDHSKLSVFFVTSYAKRRGISYISADNGKFNEEEFLMIDQRYDYLLERAYQLTDRQFIIPYLYKGKLGFVKLRL